MNCNETPSLALRHSREMAPFRHFLFKYRRAYAQMQGCYVRRRFHHARKKCSYEIKIRRRSSGPGVLRVRVWVQKCNYRVKNGLHLGLCSTLLLALKRR